MSWLSEFVGMLAPLAQSYAEDKAVPGATSREVNVAAGLTLLQLLQHVLANPASPVAAPAPIPMPAPVPIPMPAPAPIPMPAPAPSVITPG